MDHQARRHGIERFVGERKCLRGGDLEMNTDLGAGGLRPGGLRAGSGVHLRTGIDTGDPPTGSDPFGQGYGEGSGAATDVEDPLARAQLDGVGDDCADPRAAAREADGDEQVVAGWLPVTYRCTAFQAGCVAPGAATAGVLRVPAGLVWMVAVVSRRTWLTRCAWAWWAMSWACAAVRVGSTSTSASARIE